MDTTTNIWGTKRSGIEVTVTEALADRHPRHGGTLVEEARTVSGRIYRASAGYVLELFRPFSADACVYLSVLGTSVSTRAEISLFTHVGAETPSADEVEAALVAEKALFASHLEAEVDAAVAAAMVTAS